MLYVALFKRVQQEHISSLLPFIFDCEGLGVEEGHGKRVNVTAKKRRRRRRTMTQ